MLHQLVTCNFEGAHWLIFGPNVPTLIYYSHIPNIIISVFLGFYILFQNRKGLSNRILFFTIIAFEIWVFFALVFWASNRSDIIMFSWLMDILVEPLVYIGAFYLVNTLISEKDIYFSRKVILGILYLPIVVFLPTKLMLSGFDVSSCLATEGPLALYYSYFVEIFITVWTITFCVKSYLITSKPELKRKILYLSLGTLLLLFAFGWGNIIGSFTDDWVFGDYGLFGMPIFIGFLVYSIVKFKIFNTKLIATQALVFIMIALVGSLLFVVKTTNTLVVASLTLIFVSIFGYFLVRSVKKEIHQREEIQKLADQLTNSNEKLFAANEKLRELDRQKTEFVSIASHQLRSPLTAIKGYSSMLLEGSFGELSAKTHEAVDVIFQSSIRLVSVIEDFLNVTRIELGKMKYDMTVFDVRDLVKKISDELVPFAKRKNLAFTVSSGRGAFQIQGDYGKLSQVISNVIDNAIKYTPSGSVSVVVDNPPTDQDHIHVIIKDTGVGIAAESIPKLFQKFIRADEIGKTHIVGTGLGLYVVKQILDAHQASITVESPGVGKGSTFTVLLKRYRTQSAPQPPNAIVS